MHQQSLDLISASQPSLLFVVPVLNLIIIVGLIIALILVVGWDNDEPMILKRLNG